VLKDLATKRKKLIVNLLSSFFLCFAVWSRQESYESEGAPYRWQ
ncbi:MAG: hypothetical protein ACI90V_009836, partial [Bacillariaceae sp.]|jgi:hypothetical protein